MISLAISNCDYRYPTLLSLNLHGSGNNLELERGFPRDRLVGGGGNLCKTFKLGSEGFEVKSSLPRMDVFKA
jgi:hypothetical protein